MWTTFELLNVPDGTPLLIDAEMGNVFVDPDDEVLEKFWARQQARLTLADQKKLMKPRDGDEPMASACCSWPTSTC